MDNLAAFQFLFSGKAGLMVAVYKAHLHFIQWIFSAKKGKQNTTEQNIGKGFYKGSIVVDFFLKHKKTFTQIIERKSF